MARRSLTVFAVFLFCFSAQGAAFGKDNSGSAIHEIKGGILDHDTDNLWSGFSRESGIDGNLEVIFSPSLNVLGGSLRPALGTSINTAGDTSKVYLTARWEYEFEIGVFVAFGLGAAVHNGERKLVRNDRKALGSSVLFHIPAEIGYRFDDHHGVSLYFDHMSNAFLADENEGMDTIGIRYGYRF